MIWEGHGAVVCKRNLVLGALRHAVYKLSLSVTGYLSFLLVTHPAYVFHLRQVSLN